MYLSSAIRAIITCPYATLTFLSSPLLSSRPHFVCILLYESSLSEIVDEFVNAVRERYPRVLIQFEDFSNENALRLLNKYRNEILCFNDDIQGTGCVALAGLLIAMRATGSKTPEYTLAQQRILIAGAGSAGIGVANMIKEGMLHANMSNEEALKHFVLTDFKGLLGRNRKDATDEQIPFIRQDFDDQLSIEEAVAAFQPTIIIGLTGKGGLFTEKAIRTMSSYCSRPIIFPLSNPTDNAECTAKQAYEWTHGTAIVASGSPFQPVEYKGRTLYPGQSNNMYV
jgi:malate dehydrogenase (oxaloacetate-decarboxylating)(NADP+)